MPDAAKGLGWGDGLALQRRFWICCAAAVAVPLSLLARLDSLRFTSALSLCTAAYLVGLL
eukprot:gene5895-4185_t